MDHARARGAARKEVRVLFADARASTHVSAFSRITSCRTPPRFFRAAAGQDTPGPDATAREFFSRISRREIAPSRVCTFNLAGRLFEKRDNSRIRKGAHMIHIRSYFPFAPSSIRLIDLIFFQPIPKRGSGRRLRRLRRRTQRGATPAGNLRAIFRSERP